MKREEIYAALLQQLAPLQNSPYNAAVVSRDWVSWEEAQDMPAVYLVPEEEVAVYERAKQFLRWTIHAMIWVYVQKQDDLTLGAQVLALLLDGVESALMPAVGNLMGPPAGVNTLGGLVHSVAINGPTVISPGYLGEIAVARVPVEILTANFQ